MCVLPWLALYVLENGLQPVRDDVPPAHCRHAPPRQVAAILAAPFISNIPGHSQIIVPISYIRPLFTRLCASLSPSLPYTRRGSAAPQKDFATSKDVRVFPTFDAMQLKEDLLRGVYTYGTS